MIKAIILDVDGVVKGSKEGVNYPLPHKDVIDALKRIHNKGIPIILCTGNYYYSIIDIIKLANLRNPHVTDRGALIVDPLDNLVIEKHCIDKEKVKNILEALLSSQSYLEVYSDHNYYIQKDQIRELTKKRTIILRQEPIIVNSLVKETQSKDIIKINAFAVTQEEKEKITKALASLNNEVQSAWVGNPSMGAVEVVNITKKGISKSYAVRLILKNLGITTDFTLGVGDSMSDWEFMSLCKYAAAMGNASDKLKELVKTKLEGNYFIAPHVDENGLLEVFNYFNL